MLTVTCCCWVNNVTRIIYHTPMFMRLQCPRVLGRRYKASFCHCFCIFKEHYVHRYPSFMNQDPLCKIHSLHQITRLIFPQIAHCSTYSGLLVALLTNIAHCIPDHNINLPSVATPRKSQICCYKPHFRR
jgi:hypothetical protein